jgi:hypothetical protein
VSFYRKNCFDLIRKNITECCIAFVPPDKSSGNNVGGLQINQLSEDKSFLLKVKLDANNFEHFRCNEPKKLITVNMGIYILN